MRGPRPAATLAFYKEKFAGDSAKLKDRTSELAARTAELKAPSVKFTTEPRPLKLASGTVVNFAYLEGPAGAKVELVQR